MVALSSYWASVGVKVDNKDLSKVDAYLAKIENKLKRGINNSKVLFTPKINVPAFNNQIRQALKAIGADKNTLRLNVKVNESHLRNSLEKATISKPLDVRVSAKLDPSSLASIKEQLSRALAGIVVNARLGGVTSRQAASATRKQPSPTTASDSLSHAQLNTIRRQIARGVVGDSKSAEYWSSLAKLQTKTQQELLSLLQGMKKPSPNSWNPNPWGGSGNNLARWTEFMAGRPEKSSLSAANRRMSDIMMQGLTSGAPNTLTGMLAETTLGGVGRVGSSTAIGRGLGALGSTFGRAGGAWGLITGAVVNTTLGAVKGIWSGLGTMVSAPFQLISSASSAVTGAFYRIALAAAPLVMAFNGINKKTQEVSTRDIALNATAGRFGTTGAEEKRWLYNMAMTEGMRYNDMIMPYSSFLSAYAPKGGVEASRDMFQAFSQYGRVFGATKESSGRAFYALSQIASKDQFMSEEVNFKPH